MMQNIQNRYSVSWSWMPGRWRPSSSCQTGLGSPGLASAVDRNWTLECTDRNLDQDPGQDSKQGPLQEPDMGKDSETLLITQL